MTTCRDVQKVIAGQPPASSGAVPQYQQQQQQQPSKGSRRCGLRGVVGR